MLPSILNTFTIHGPNGNHACYVTFPARASLSGLKDDSWIHLYQLDVARALAAQLVLAVDHVHTQGIVHGDLHMSNILLKTSADFDQLTLDQSYEKYGTPELFISMESRFLLLSHPTALCPSGSGKQVRKSHLQELGSCLQTLARPFHTKKS